MNSFRINRGTITIIFFIVTVLSIFFGLRMAIKSLQDKLIAATSAKDSIKEQEHQNKDFPQDLHDATVYFSGSYVSSVVGAGSMRVIVANFTSMEPYQTRMINRNFYSYSHYEEEIIKMDSRLRGNDNSLKGK